MIGVQSDFLDVDENPEDPSQLYGYQWVVTGGSVTIEKVSEPEDGGKYPTYTVKCDMTGEIVDQETGEVIDSRPLSATYSGVIPFEDPNAYTPIGHDVEMTIPNLSGRFSDGGQWTLTFYGVDLDEEGYIIGAGELFNVELVTEDPGYMNCELLPGTYTPGDMFGSISAGNFGKGVWYNLFGWQTAVGTALSIYDERATLDRVGLAEIGEISVSKVSDEVYHFDFDVTTPEGDKLTGSWEGRIKDFVADRSSGSGVGEVDAAGAVKGCRGYIEAPEGARAFNAAGVETGLTDLAAGIYIVRFADRAVKVVVK